MGRALLLVLLLLSCLTADPDATYRCPADGRCDDGLRCVDGWCVRVAGTAGGGSVGGGSAGGGSTGGGSIGGGSAGGGSAGGGSTGGGSAGGGSAGGGSGGGSAVVCPAGFLRAATPACNGSPCCAAVSVAAGPTATCAVGVNGGVWCWGDAGVDEPFNPGPTPQQLSTREVAQAAVALESVCLLHRDGGVRCSASLVDAGFPASVCMVAGNPVACGLGAQGALSCALQQQDGFVASTAPFMSGPLPQACEQRVAAAASRVCWRTDGGISCRDADAGLAFHSCNASSFSGLTACEQISLAANSICAVQGNRAACFGGTPLGAASSFVADSGILRVAIANNSFVCVSTQAGDTLCTMDAGELQPVAALRRAASLSAGSRHLCAIIDGGVFCFGENADGRCGVPDASYLFAPRAVGGP